MKFKRSIPIEKERRQVNRVYEMLGRCNKAVIRATDEPSVLQEICHLLVEEGGYRLAWVGLVEEDQAKTVRPVAQAGFADNYLETVTITWDESEHGRGPTGTAIRTGQPVVVRNILSDPAYAPWREAARRRGYASSIALPLVAGDRTFGAINLYAAEPDAFNLSEAELLRRLADDLAFGLQALRARRALEESEAKYRAFMYQAPNGVFLADATGRFVEVNPRGCALSGYTKDEILQLRIQDLIHPEDLATQPIPFDALHAGNPVLVERRLRRKDGSLILVEISAKMLDNGLIQGFVRDITERKRMEEEIRDQAARYEALLRVSSRLNAQLELESILQLVCEETSGMFGVPVAAILLYDEERDVLNLAAASGLPPRSFEQLKPVLHVFYEEGVQQKTRFVTIPDVHSLSDRFPVDSRLDYDLRSILGAEIERDGQLLGFLTLITRGEVRRFTAGERSLLEGLADQAAQAITNARLFNGTRRRLKFLQALRNIDMAITGSLDIRVTFSVALDEITAQLELDAAAILILNLHTQTLEYRAWRGFRQTSLQGRRVRLGEDYAGRAAFERRTVHIPFLPEAPSESAHAKFLAAEGFVTYYAIPLIAKGQLQGVLEVANRSTFEANSEWCSFLEALAGQTAIAIDNIALLDQLQRSHSELVLAYDSTIEGWSRALDMRDKETEGHSHRVTEMTVQLAQAFGIKEDELVHIRRGALLHDIGKMGVPDGILLKAGPLTPEEWKIMRRHPQYAYEMLSPIAYLRPALDIPYCHHEKWDGSGYPRGLKGEQIPLAARLFAVVDVWDALSSDRPYRPAWPPEKVFAYLKEQAGKHFDPRVVEVFLGILSET